MDSRQQQPPSGGLVVPGGVQMQKIHILLSQDGTQFVDAVLPVVNAASPSEQFQNDTIAKLLCFTLQELVMARWAREEQAKLQMEAAQREQAAGSQANRAARRHPGGKGIVALRQKAQAARAEELASR